MISEPRTQFVVVSWPEERSFETDRKVSSSAQTRPVPPWNPCIDATPLISAPVSFSPYRSNKLRMSGQKEAQCVLRLLFARGYFRLPCWFFPTVHSLKSGSAFP